MAFIQLIKLPIACCILELEVLEKLQAPQGFLVQLAAVPGSDLHNSASHVACTRAYFDRMSSRVGCGVRDKN